MFWDGQIEIAKNANQNKLARVWDGNINVKYNSFGEDQAYPCILEQFYFENQVLACS